MKEIDYERESIIGGLMTLGILLTIGLIMEVATR
jgi:hypothetical protein